MYDSHELCASENPNSSFPRCSAAIPSQNSHPFTSQPSVSDAKQSSLNYCPKIRILSVKCYRETQ